MFSYSKTFIFSIGTLIFILCQRAQSQILCQAFVIKEIEIIGAEKTKDWVIKYESNLNEGDNIQSKELASRLNEARDNLKRTGLFSKVELSYIINIDPQCEISVQINVSENWLLIPDLVFELVDRNFNVWWKEFNHDLSRTNYGVGLSHYNLSGRADQVKAKLTGGYSHKLEAYYKSTYLPINKKVNLGVGVSYIEYKELAYSLKKNKLLLYSEPNKNSLIKLSLYTKSEYRWDRKKRISQLLEFIQYKSVDSILTLAPDYFMNGKTKQFLFKGTSGFIWNTSNDPIRPIYGFYLETNLNYLFDFEKQKQLKFSFKFSKTNRISNRFRAESKLQSGVSLIRNKPSFNIYSGLGSEENNIDGYELYQISGMDFVNFSSGLYFHLVDYNRAFFKFFRKEPRIRISLIDDIFMRMSIARVNDPFYFMDNHLSNVNLASVAIGSQISINSVLKLEVDYSVNHLGEGGFYFHTIKAF